jgi:tetratricopeptide (TPR) repeat protein
VVSAPIYCRRFIGRSSHLTLLRERFSAAASGNGSLILIAGEPGIGKSRLLSEFIRSLESDDAFVVQGSCFEYVQSPFGPFVDALRALLAIEPKAWKPNEAQRGVLARLIPELGKPANSGDAGSEAEKRRQLDALAEALLGFASLRPTVVAIEDLHCADLASLECLQHILTMVPSSRILVLGTLRPEVFQPEHPLRSAVARLDLRPSVWLLELETFNDREIRELIRAAMEGRKLPGPETIAAIARLAEGNPLFAEELLKNSVESAARDTVRVDLPLSLRAAMLERMQHFNEDERSVLAHAAAIGRRFEPQFLAVTAGQPLAGVLRVLKRALDLQLIVEEPDDPPHYAFRHALTREAVYSELMAAEARPLHARIAQQIEALPDASTRVSELAYHWWEARHTVKAASYNEAAGDAAAHVFAHRDAATYYERALQCTPQPGFRQAALHEKLGSTLSCAGFPERAVNAFQAAVGYYRDTSDVEKTCELSMRIGLQYWYIHETENALQWASMALRAIESNPDHPLYHAALIRVARSYALRGDAESAFDYLERAEAFHGAPLPESLADFHNYRGLAWKLRGEASRAIASFQSAIALSAESGDPYASIRPYGNLGYSAICLGETDIAADACDEAARLAREKSMPSLESWAMHNRAVFELFAGNVTRARKILDRAMTVDAETDTSKPGIGGTWLAIPIGLRGADDDFAARFACPEVIELAFRTGEPQHIGPISASFAELYTHHGELAESRALLHRAAMAVTSIAAAPWFPLAVAMYGDLEDLPRVRELLAQWAQPRDNRAGPAYLALADAYAARNRGASPTAYAEKAAERFAEIRFSYYEALALELANRPEEALERYRRAGDVRDARRLEADLTPVNPEGAWGHQ